MTKEREQYLKKINGIVLEYINTPETLRSLTKLLEKYGIKRQTISKYLKEHGLEVVNYQNISRINENIFDNINTEDKAYWLGFLYADGYLASEGNRVGLALAVADLEHMNKYKKFLEYTGTIEIYDEIKKDGTLCQYCRIAVRNKHMWEQLYNKGCLKSLVFPDKSIFSNDHLIRHFIRGYCDGSLGLYKNDCKISFIGTELFLISLQALFNIPGYIRNKSYIDHPNKAFELKYSGYNAKKIARYLYENSTIFLERKYNIYKSFCHFEEGSSKAKSSKNGES